MISKSGKWVEPQQDMRNMSVTTGPPPKKVIVEVAPRERFRDGLWAFKLTRPIKDIDVWKRISADTKYHSIQALQ